MTFIYRNMSSLYHLTNFKSFIVKTAPNMRAQAPRALDIIKSGTTQTHMALLDLYIPFVSAPELVLTFTLCPLDGMAVADGGGGGGSLIHHKYILPLPMCLGNFLSPVLLSPTEIKTRWDAMEGSEAVKKGPCKKSMDPSHHDSLHVGSLFVVIYDQFIIKDNPTCETKIGEKHLTVLVLCQNALRFVKLGIGADPLDESGSGLCCATALNTRFMDKKNGVRILVGCIAKVLVKDRNATIVVRSPDRNFPELMANYLLSVLSSGRLHLKPSRSAGSSVKGAAASKASRASTEGFIVADEEEHYGSSGFE
jgi:hypothetical protein